MNNEVFESYLSLALDRDLSPAEFHEFEQYLISSPEARARYMEYVDLHTVLDLELAKSAPELPGTSKIVDIKRIVRRQNRRTLKTVALSTAAILLVGLISMQLFFISSPEPTIVFETSHGTQYSLSHNSTKEAPEGLVLEKGSRLQLSQGSVELTFASGVSSIIMAPADLTLRDEDVVFLSEGTAWFHVPEEAVGFTVKTKDLDIVDLGTEFGVLARTDDYNEVHVFKGKVRASALLHRKESAILNAGEARRIDSIGRLSAIPENPSAFLTSLPDTLPYLHWSFDGQEGIQVTGTHPDVATIHTTAMGATNFTKGKHGQAISLDGISQHLSTDWPGFEGNRARTVSFWLKLPANGDYKALPGIVGWGDRSGGNVNKWKVLMVNSKKGAPVKLRLSWANVWLTSRAPLATSQWQHVTVTSNGNVNEQGYPDAELYVNGQKQAATYGKQIKDVKSFTFGTSIKTQSSKPLLIGADLYLRQKDKNFFNGKIDELYIFDGHMTEAEVQKIYNR